MKKNKIAYLSFLLLGVLTLFNSCEDIIDINLNNANPNVVIEANVVNNGLQTVKVTKTKSFNDNNTAVSINGANISVTEEGGSTYTFTEQANLLGNYYSNQFVGKPGKKYTIKVNINGKIYTANSTMPQPVKLDSISVTELTFFTNKRKYLQVHYKDPAKIANQYNYVLNINGEIRNAYYVDSDRFNDGNNVTNTIFNSDPEIKSGDKITLDFQCIDELIYRYFFAISQIAGNGGPPTSPANPDSNFDNGALGYFSAHTSQKVSATVK
ncbi:MAG: DUF4249 domain-containing protein [Bacteroidetes bacterium]|nr:DUF4249 domain-containing protein [Bacteroidota bacterium]MBU1373995.1 DUF4249 domain-containing protein [Bacteroidota bacterium]MBU1484665.1 DUF4249 domain-containing protein [Bacteroidota bacterium]MBU1759750.1 DUF4249 domain-containing protein [Bacteroidota bacterium]MBU2377439.1 DUF4249 domain-containing protein [Bacteroidota bacterium]